MDLINALGICYDPRIQSFISAIADEPPATAVTSNSDIYLRPWEAKTMRLRLSNWTSTDHTAIVDVSTPELPNLFANSGVATVFDTDKVNYLLKNCSGEELLIPRGYPLGQAEPIERIDAVRTTEFLDIPEKFPPPLKQDGKTFLDNLNLNVPDHGKKAYQDILLANHDVFSKDPGDLGEAQHFKHTIQLKDFDPVYQKQFRIPEQHESALQEQVKEWLFNEGHQ